MKTTRDAGKRGLVVTALCLLVMVLAFSLGCATVGERSGRDTTTAHVGVYNPPPPGFQRVRVGVPPFQVDPPRGPFDFSPVHLQGMAADQLTTLLFQSGRFDVIERAQLTQLLREQDLEGIVRAGELAQQAQVRGVDYLVLGKVSGLRVTASRRASGVGLQRGRIAEQLGNWTGGVERQEMIITTDMGVDLRIVDPSTGEVKVAHFTQYRQEDTASSMGIEVAGLGGRGEADVAISQDDAGRIMRMAFDDTLRKMMPEIDRRLLTRPATAMEAAPAPETAPAPVAASFCGQCGARLAAGARFCGECGERVP